MKFISYNKDEMTLRIGKKYLQCPFATWWKAREFFVRPKFTMYFGPMFKNNIQRGFWPFASTRFVEWNTKRWFPIYVSSWNIMWKDKFESPRYEHPGYFALFFGRNYRTCWQFAFIVKAPETYNINDCTRKAIDEGYWESVLDYLNYTDENKTKFERLIEARECGHSQHWSESKTTIIENNEYEILSTRIETFNDCDFLVLTCDSKRIYDFCDYYPAFNTNTEFMLQLINPDKTEHMKGTTFMHTKYIKCEYVAPDIKQHIVELWFGCAFGEDLNEMQEKVNNDKYIKELRHIQRIDLGPQFKDEFLNKKTQRAIINYYKNA